MRPVLARLFFWHNIADIVANVVAVVVIVTTCISRR